MKRPDLKRLSTGAVPVAAAEALPAPRVEGGLLWSTVVPALLFLVAFLATWMLYRHFAGKPGGEG